MKKLIITVGVVAALCAIQPIHADFIVPIETSIQDGSYETPDIAIDTSDNVSVIYTQDEQIFFASSLIGFGDDEVEVTDSEVEVSAARVAVGPLGLTYVIFARASTEPGAVGNDVVLTRNTGGVFQTPQELAESEDDEFEPEIDVVLGEVHAAWATSPDGGDPEVYYSFDEEDGTFVENGKAPQVVATSDGDAHMVYQRGGEVYYRRYNSETESFEDEENVSDRDGTEIELGVVADSDDVVHVVFVNDDTLYHTDNSLGVFTEADVLDDGPIEEAALAAGPDGQIAVVVVDTAGLLQVIEIDDGVAEDVETISETTEAEEPQADYDSAGYLHVVYAEAGAIYYTNNVPLPIVDFTADVTVGEVPLTVEFENLTEGIVNEWLWEFGDGSSSPARNPTHTFQEIGNHTVRLTATGPGGVASRARVGFIDVNEATNVMRVADISVAPGDFVKHPVYGTTSTPIQGYLMIVGFDEDLVPVDEIDFSGSTTGSMNPEFEVIDEELDGENSTISISVIFDTEFPFDGRTIAPGKDQLLLSLAYTVPADAEVGDSAEITLVNDEPTLNIYNANVGELGVISVVPYRVAGTYEVTTEVSDVFLRGDANLDGGLGLVDPVVVLQWMFTNGDEPACLDAADFDDNGGVTLVDIILELGHIFQGGAAPPYPYPEEGIDPTDDDLECDN